MSTVNKITVTKNSSSNTYGLKDIDALRSAALTNVENEFVATKAYAINDYLYRDDIFYKVIAPIPRGGTFVINQNIKATMLTNELAMLNPTVIANPSGEAATNLIKLQVGNVIYKTGEISVENITENIENETTSSQAYAIGDYFYKDNKIYKVKAVIAQGDTFIINTNIEETNITNEINMLKTNFQDGVDAVYNACVSKGSTPSSHSLADIIDAINNI